MKILSIRHLVFSIAICLIHANYSIAQSLEWLLKFSGEINTGTDILKQNFALVEGKACAVVFTTEKTDKKGSTEITKSEFYLSDIDENTVRYKVSGKIVNVEMSTRGSQKFIKDLKDAEIQAYTSELTLVTDNPDKARELVDAFKKNIPLCKKQEIEWKDPSAALLWISSNLGSFTVSGTEYQQTFSSGKTGVNLAEFLLNQKDSKGIITSYAYYLNLTDIDPAGVKLNVAGKNLTIVIPVKDNKKFVKNLKNNEQQNYISSFEIQANDLDIAREIMAAFKYAVPLLKPQQKSFKNSSEATTWLGSSFGEFTIGANRYNQKLELVAERKGQYAYTSARTDSKGATVEEKYLFYLSDLDEPAVSIEVNGKSITIGVGSKKKDKFIQAYKSGELQNYTDKFEITSDDIEKAKDIQNALKTAISAADAGAIQWTDKQKALDWVVGQITDVEGGGIKTVQKFSYDPAKDFNALLSVNTINNGNETPETYAFYLSDIDPAAMEIAVNGKKLTVGLSSGKQKLVKIERSGQLQNYASTVEISVNDVLKAKNIVAALSYAIPQCRPTTGTWKDISSALEWLNKQISQTSTGVNAVDQKIELLENEKCKIKFSAVSTDSKGVTTEFIHEFNLADIDANSVEFDVSGKEISLTLNCKGKQKLIKPYKNGEVQNFSAFVKIVSGDVMEAREIQNAIRSLIGMCSK